MNEQVSKAVESAIVTFNYEGSPVSFSNGDGVMVNATEMAKSFGKRPDDYLKTKQAKEFVAELSITKKIVIDDLVQVRVGSPENGGGTWMHEDVALVFAQWLSPKFYIWCNDRIKELLTQGVATVTNEDDVIAQAMQVLQRRLEEKKRLLAEKEQHLQMAQSTIEEQEREIKTLAPAAEYTRDVLQSTSTYTFTQVAKDMGMRSVGMLTEFMHKHHIIYRQSNQWLPTANYAQRGFFDTRTAKYVKSDNTIGTSLSTVITEKGRCFLHHFYQQTLTKQAL